MSTVSKPIADKLIAGNGYYPGDHVRVVKIVEYSNQWDGLSYGLIYEGQHLDTYAESPYVRQPKTIWEAK